MQQSTVVRIPDRALAQFARVRQAQDARMPPGRSVRHAGALPEALAGIACSVKALPLDAEPFVRQPQRSPPKRCGLGARGAMGADAAFRSNNGHCRTSAAGRQRRRVIARLDQALDVLAGLALLLSLPGLWLVLGLA